jgi:hypothetical protein
VGVRVYGDDGTVSTREIDLSAFKCSGEGAASILEKEAR